MTESGTIALTRVIPVAQDAVWSALTDPSIVEAWWAAGDVRPVVGHTFTLDMGPFGQQRCEVLAADPKTLFVFSFGVGMLDTTITWRLEASGGGTTLSFEHAGFDLESPIGQAAFQGMRAGWPSILTRLEGALAPERHA